MNSSESGTAYSIPYYYCRSIVRQLAGSSISTDWKFEACFVFTVRMPRASPNNSFLLRRLAQKQWVGTSVVSTFRTTRSRFYGQFERHTMSPSEYPEARSPIIPFCARRVAQKRWVNTFVHLIFEIYLPIWSAIRNVTACFYPRYIRRAAQ